MDLGIRGRRAVVCASSRGLGRACAEALAAAGCEVVINGVDAERLARTADEIAAATGARVIPVPGDVSRTDVQDALIAANGSPDILVNNNGGPPFRDFRDIDRRAMLDGLIMNMVTPIELIQRVVDPMMERGFGRIVNITSYSVLQAIPGLDLSSAARAGLTGFLSGVARQVANRGVTINNLLPGNFETDRIRAMLASRHKATGRSEEDIASELKAAIPAGRFGEPSEFGSTCAFLCSVHAGYITAQNILIDGGNVRASF
jgi:3-oxoacyl-[acyl-carrier protein] reductase